ncbi:MAG: hypothetical protein M1833_002128 [Piccolia ochrophora]|nr:MAG: hypothetical protein M1833_002128 [Piccolia ochrophora]
MQSLWARATQLGPRCRCPLCHSTPTLASRRATTVVSRRAVTLGEAFTCFYSTILATATIIDGKYKDDRRNEWDRLIKETNKEVDALRKENERVPQPLEDREQPHFRYYWHTDFKGPRTPVRSRTCTEEGTKEGDQLIQETRKERKAAREEDTGAPHCSGCPEQPSVRYSYPKESKQSAGSQTPKVDLEEWDPNAREPRNDCDLRSLAQGRRRKKDWLETARLATMNLRECTRHIGHTLRIESEEPSWGSNETISGPYKQHSPRQLRVQERSVAALVTSLLLKISPGPPGASRTSTTLGKNCSDDEYYALVQKLGEVERYMFKNVHSSAAAGSPQFPCYYSTDREPSREEGIELSRALAGLFAEFNQKRASLETLVAGICFNLLISGTPPNTDTYNLLITHLCRIRQNEMVRRVIQSFLESRVSPNEVTISAIAKFYSVTNDVEGFQKFIAPMRTLPGGAGDRDLGTRTGRDRGLGLPLNVRSVKDSTSEMYLKGRKVVYSRGRIILGAPRNEVAMGALIQAAFRFRMIRRATVWWRAMLRRGWQPNLQLLTTVLCTCLREGDWFLGVKVWSMMNSLEELDAVAYGRMLQLCRKCHQDAAFQCLFREALRLGFPTVSSESAPRTPEGVITVQNDDEIMVLEYGRKVSREERTHTLTALGLARVQPNRQFWLTLTELIRVRWLNYIDKERYQIPGQKPTAGSWELQSRLGLNRPPVGRIDAVPSDSPALLTEAEANRMRSTDRKRGFSRPELAWVAPLESTDAPERVWRIIPQGQA